MRINSSLPAIFDMDIGKDPDDTVVACMIARNPEFNTVLCMTNDETLSKSRARFLSQIVDCPIGAGLPSIKNREDILVERAGLITRPQAYEENGIALLRSILYEHPRVNYFGLGALTNLAAVLEENSSLVERINLIQMGPVLARDHSVLGQYNMRIDPAAFRAVLARVKQPTLVMSHSTWGCNERGEQEVGFYKHDKLYAACRLLGDKNLELLADHVDAWVDTGKDCSIMHDPITVLSQYHDIVPFVSGNVILEGMLASADDPTREILAKQGITSRPSKGGLLVSADISLRTNYAQARRCIAKYLLGDPVMGDIWRS